MIGPLPLAGARSGWPAGRVIAALITLCSIALAIKYFPGLESSQYYAGLTLQAIMPDALANDPVHGLALSVSGTPYKLSAFYLLPRLFGELWLDDRFVLPFYILMVAASFLAVDRFARLFGLDGLAERAVCQLMFMRDHQIVANKVIFAHDPDFHHSALALPLSLWLLYFGLAGRGWAKVMVMAAVMAAVSLQVTPTSAAIAIAALTIGTSPGRQRLALATLAAGLGAAYVVLFHLVAPPPADRAELWHLLTTLWFKNMADPFNTIRDGLVATVIGNVLFVALCLATLLWRGPAEAPIRRLRLVAAVSLGLWLAAGLYVHFAPPGLQHPQLLLFPYARQLQGPQVVMYVGLTALVLRWARRTAAPWQQAVAIFAIGALFVAGPGNHLQWAGLYAAGGAAAAALLWWRSRASAAVDGGLSVRWVAAGGLALAALVGSSVSTLSRLPDLAHLAQTGIHGRSAQAKWVGVAAYLRANTPPGSVLLPLEYRGETTPIPDFSTLTVRREIASRSGRAVALPYLLGHGLKLDYFRWALRQRQTAFAIGEDWMRGDSAAVIAGLTLLEPSPDYIVVRTPEAGKIGGLDFPFRAEAEINGWTVLRRIAGKGTVLP
ncbi:hypothetical protein [Magnetospirillum sp. UT-4]|uniref:hypothetical protein n=1 Tax=Magnetospirillum sp. UT-4 TaxID=2681467 RepID=UPI00138220BF|nr:hypothetical protein [Magnetospirillum sp. UT-4]CAA7621817.1 membrane hypothetical protein [Magnetospirillum sp. UT-4]